MVSITGPRQSGKTTLAKMLFPDHEYISLERPDFREQAEEDPNRFLRSFNHGVILDEVQRAPDLFSYIQVIVDEQPQPARFVLTGSQNFLLLETNQPVARGARGDLSIAPLLIRRIADLEV